MADVEQRAEAEAAHKGLTGQARASYVGGVFNRIRQAHSRATTPGAGARHLNRAARKEARREAQNRRDRLTERANGEAFRLRARTRREEPRERKPARAPEQAAPAATPPQRPAAPAATARPATKLPPAGSKPRQPLVPTKPIENFQLDATRKVDPYFIREHFGDKQLPTALEVQTPKNLAEAVSVVEKKTGKKYAGSKRDRGAMYDWILANM